MDASLRELLRLWRESPRDAALLEQAARAHTRASCPLPLDLAEAMGDRARRWERRSGSAPWISRWRVEHPRRAVYVRAPRLLTRDPDYEGASRSLDALSSALAGELASGVEEALLDLRDGELLDSEAAGALVACGADFARAGGRLVLVAVPPTFALVLQMLGLDAWFASAPTLPEAVALQD